METAVFLLVESASLARSIDVVQKTRWLLKDFFFRRRKKKEEASALKHLVQLPTIIFFYILKQFGIEKDIFFYLEDVTLQKSLRSLKKRKNSNPLRK